MRCSYEQIKCSSDESAYVILNSLVSVVAFHNKIYTI